MTWTWRVTAKQRGRIAPFGINISVRLCIPYLHMNLSSYSKAHLLRGNNECWKWRHKTISVEHKCKKGITSYKWQSLISGINFNLKMTKFKLPVTVMTEGVLLQQLRKDTLNIYKRQLWLMIEWFHTTQTNQLVNTVSAFWSVVCKVQRSTCTCRISND